MLVKAFITAVNGTNSTLLFYFTLKTIQLKNKIAMYVWQGWQESQRVLNIMQIITDSVNGQSCFIIYIMLQYEREWFFLNAFFYALRVQFWKKYKKGHEEKPN